MALVGALGTLATRTPIVLAVDDVQWLDSPSAAVIAFALRPLQDPATASLLARRGTEGPALGLKPDALQLVTLEPLSVGALHRIIVDLFGAAYSRPVLRRLYATSGGNPFFAIELPRALDRLGVQLRASDDLPVPTSLDALVSERLAALSPGARRTVAAAGLLPRPTTSDVGTGPPPDEALAAGVLEAREWRPHLYASTPRSRGPHVPDAPTKDVRSTPSLRKS